MRELFLVSVVMLFGGLTAFTIAVLNPLPDSVRSRIGTLCAHCGCGEAVEPDSFWWRCNNCHRWATTPRATTSL